jgi:hypothetical protein
MHVVLQCVRLVLCMCVQAPREGKYCTVVTATLLIQIVSCDLMQSTTTRFGTKIVIILSDHARAAHHAWIRRRSSITVSISIAHAVTVTRAEFQKPTNARAWNRKSRQAGTVHEKTVGVPRALLHSILGGAAGSIWCGSVSTLH